MQVLFLTKLLSNDKKRKQVAHNHEVSWEDIYLAHECGPLSWFGAMTCEVSVHVAILMLLNLI